VIYVATVHFQSPKWIDVQQAYLRRHISQPFKTFAVLEGIPRQHHDAFDRVIASKGSHEGHLNLLAAEIGAVADPADILVFLDGDAFPVADPWPAITSALRQSQMLAVRRDENHGDRQPHPCFCAIEVREWQRIHGDWCAGYEWTNDTGRTTSDVGGNLLGIVERNNLAWTPLLRTNTRNDHPLWFAVYGDLIYHHGAGFRRPFSRVDEQKRPKGVRGGRIPLWHDIAVRLTARRRRIWTEEVMRNNEELGERWFERLKNDPDFYLELTQP
jgi:hypothetical protein